MEDAQRAVFHLLRHLSDATPALHDTSPPERARWVAALNFLQGCHALPALDGLSTALQELDRGSVSDSLAPPAGGLRGGLADTTKLRLMSFAVEAADELRRECAKYIIYRDLLRAECNTQTSTIENYRKALAGAPEDLRPRGSYVLAWGREQPAAVLRRVMQIIRDLR